MYKRTILAAALLAFMAAPAFAGQCPRLVSQIDAALGQNPQLAADVLAKIKELRDQGAALHASRTHGEAVAALNEAKGLLGI